MTGQAFDHQRLRRSFLGLSGLYVIGIPLMLLANIILARTLSVAEFGTFGFSISVATVLAIPVSGGLPMLLTREIAAYSQKKNWTAYRGLILAAHGWVAAISALIGLGLLGWMLVAAGILATPLLIAFLLVPFLGLTAIRNGIFKGLGRPILAEAPSQVLQPTLMILGYLALAWLGLSSATNALVCYFIVVVVVFGLASVGLRRVQPEEVHSVGSATDDLPRWRRAILPLIMVSAASVLSAQIGVLLLGYFGQEEAVAHMRVAERGAQLVILPLVLINTAIGPYFIQAINADEPDALLRIARQSARMTLAASLPIALIFLFFGRSLIDWSFGAPYGDLAYLPMMIMIGATLISVGLGSADYLLAVTGHEKLALISQLVGIAALLTIGLTFIPSFGVLAASIAAATAVILAKAVALAFVLKIHGISLGLF